MQLSVNQHMFVYELVDTWPITDQLSIECQSGVDQDIDQVLTIDV